MEEWKSIPGFEGIYEASSEGRIRSLDRITAKNAFKKGEIKTINVSKQTGYGMVSLWKNGVERRDTVHVLVLESFRGPRPEGHYGCHNDGIRTNNKLSNLRWGTPSSNNRDKRIHGTDTSVNKVNCPRGHELKEPNLVPAKLRIGIRECQACSYAQSKFSRSGDDRETIADSRYEEIMSNNPLTRPWKEPDTCRRGHRFTKESEHWRIREGKTFRECSACMKAVEVAKSPIDRMMVSWRIYTDMTGIEMSNEMKEAFDEYTYKSSRP